MAPLALGAALPADLAELRTAGNRGVAAGADRRTGVSAVADEALAIEIDAQLMQLTLRASHPQALPPDVAGHEDVLAIFGSVSMQASALSHALARRVFRLVGRGHDVAVWTADARPVPTDCARAYFPGELYAEEQAWLPDVLEPVRDAYLTSPQPLELFLPDEPLPADARVAYLAGCVPDRPGLFIELFVYRERRLVLAFRIESYGRRRYRTLEYCSDARFCYAPMQPSFEPRQQPWPPWERHGAGHPLSLIHI